MRRTEMKKKNSIKKTIIILIAILVVSFILGFLFGKGAKKLQNSGFTLENIGTAFKNHGAYAVLAIQAVTIALCAIISCATLGKAKKSFSAWDGEDEKTIDGAEKDISYGMISSNVCFILNFVYFGMWVYFEKFIDSGKLYLLATGMFILNMIIQIVLQRTFVELEKKMNPTMKGEVLDFNFNKEWENSADEAQKLEMYRAGYRAFKATSGVCMILWVVAVICELTFNMGVAPVIFIGIIWLSSIVSYSVEAFKIENGHK
jgi:hypothetical protein